jgi:hypothetical protein
MAYNFLDLVNKVNRRLNEVELTSANFATATGFYSSAKDAVNASIRHINHEEFQWPWNHVEEEDTLTAGVTRYGIPYDTKTIDMDSFRIKKDSDLNVSTTKLTNINYQEYLDRFLDYEYNTDTGIRGLPKYVCRTPSEEFIIVPTPDKAYEIVYEYYRNPVELETYSDVPTIPEQFSHVIVDGAMFYAYQFRGDSQASQIAQNKFQEGIKFMRTLYLNRHDYVRSTVIQQPSVLTPKVF